VQALVNIQIQGIDPVVPIEIRIGIVVGTTYARAMSRLIQVQIQRIDTAIIVQITIADVAVCTLISESIKLVIGAKKFSLLSVTEFFNKIDPNRKFSVLD